MLDVWQGDNMEERLIITVKPGGATQIKVQGVKGSGCKALTKDFEEALGQVTSDKPTAEMRETIGRVQRQNQSRG
jgi:hypothetical protein